MIRNIGEWLNNLTLRQKGFLTINLVFLGVFLYGFIDFEGMILILFIIFSILLTIGFVGLIMILIIMVKGK